MTTGCEAAINKQNVGKLTALSKEDVFDCVLH